MKTSKSFSQLTRIEKTRIVNEILGRRKKTNGEPMFSNRIDDPYKPVGSLSDPNLIKPEDHDEYQDINQFVN